MLLAFMTAGGETRTPDAANTWAQIALVLAAGVLGGAVLLLGARGAFGGSGAFWLFAGLAGLTFLSMAWSVQPAYSWLEANGTLSYLAAFAAGIALARLFPARWPALIGALAVYAAVISGFALATKVFPAAFGAVGDFPRLRAPFDYFNATGLVAAMGLPAWMWLAAAPWPADLQGPASRRLARVLSVPALGTLVCALVLSYGRGALAAAVIGLGIWFALVPTRLRGALVLACGVAGGAGVSLWASTRHALTGDHVALSERVGAGHSFGLVLLVALVVLLTAGFAVAAALERERPSATVRRRIGTALLVALALVPVAAVVGLATSSRGLGGEVSHLWSSLVSPNSGASNSPSRITDLGSSRPRYWGDAVKVGEHAVVAGTGAFGFITACRRYEAICPPHAHSYLAQTFADLGLIGVALSLALLVAWALAVRRTLGGPRGVASDASDASDARAPERAGLVTLLAVAVTFGIHSTVDWTWFIPGAAVPALVCAGWLAGRDPLPSPAGRMPRPRGISEAPLRTAGILGVCALVLLCAWVIWQPQRSFNADSAAIAALMKGNAGTALTDARTAAASDPVDVSPLKILSVIYADERDLAAARHELVEATTLQPSNPDPWLDLAQFDAAHGRPADAARELSRARILDPHTSGGA